MKYALIENGSIKVGPREWHPVFFDEYLKANQVDFTSPLAYNSHVAIVVNDSIKIVAVQDPIEPAYDPIVEQLAGPFYDTVNNPVTGYYDVVDVPILAAKNKLLEAIAAERYKKENTTIKVNVQGTEVSVDTHRGHSREMWSQALAVMASDSIHTYKFPKEQVWLQLTKEDVALVASSVLQSVQAAFDWESDLASKVFAADTKQQLQEIYKTAVKTEPVGV